MDETAFYLPALIVLLAFSAFFSGSEAALFSLSRTHVRTLKNRSRAGREISGLLEQPRKLLITILLGNLIINIFATSAAASIALRLFGEKGLGYAFVVMSVLIVTFGEIFPKVIALHRPERFATLTIFPLRFFHALFLPVRIPLWRFSNAIIDFLRSHLGQAQSSLTWEEIVTALRIGRREGVVGSFEYEVLSNILQFREKIVKEIMTPSIHVVSLPVSMRRGELVERFLGSGLSRVPIHKESPDDIIGILHIKDLVDPRAADSEAGLRSLLRPVLFVPETSRVSELYAELQKRNAHIAAVIDEYGSFVGIVTMEDVLEELVGEIRDARDPKTQQFMKIDDRRVIVLGTMEIDEFNELFGTRIVDERNETIAGYVIAATGKIPHEGESFIIGDLKFRIISAQPNRVRKMQVEKP